VVTNDAQKQLEPKTNASPIRRVALWILFAVLLAIPKTLGLRRHPSIWNLLRFGAVSGGVAIAAFSWIHGARTALVAGILLSLLALFTPPERRRVSVDHRARELGALIVVDGGRFRAADGALREVRLFVAPDRVLALDSALRTLLEIPWAQVTHLRIERAGDDWKVRIARDRSEAELIYSGPFAEHLAQVAESTMRSQLRRELPVLP
jgi:hypothetical protein